MQDCSDDFEIRVPSVRSEPGEAQSLVAFPGEFEPEMIEDRIEEVSGRGVDQTVQDQEPGVAAQLSIARRRSRLQPQRFDQADVRAMLQIADAVDRIVETQKDWRVSGAAFREEGRAREM